ncbi:aldehyde dehydrogenase [Novosphingobium rosa]|uniref:aldehyde dehydrogenase n=1 Tax=Novosphingobium rosa TaxID=76978 RepID=UPI000AAB4FDC|nr:aldehyde dehydrogenase [Novosphingobium rosa]
MIASAAPMATIETRAFIAGTFRHGAGAAVDSINPADGSVVATLHHCTAEDAQEAIAAGKAAAEAPAWRDMLPHNRARILHHIADGIEAQIAEIAALQTADTGKTLAETGALAQSASGTFRYVAAALETMDEALTTPRGPYLTMSIHEPIGVVAAINPWNSPIASDAQKIAPALAGGNAVVLKPAEWTPLVSLKLAQICADAGLPAGLLSVLPGRGSVIGDVLVRHPDVGRIAFTGGTVTGRRVAAAAAVKFMPASLELGGKSPTIVFEDADIEQAVAGVMYGVFSSTGQSCIAGSRLFVARAIYDRFMARLVECTQALRVGPGTDAATQVAPMVHHSHRDSVAAHVAGALADGATLLCGGRAPEGPLYDKGAYYLPTILEGLPNSATICQEEVFGPVLVALPFEDEADLIAQANDSVFGLACGLWTADYRRAWRFARAIKAGTVWINTYKQFSSSTPFGGVKDSGMGREKGRDWIRSYMHQKALYWGMDEAPLAWAKTQA